MVVETKQLLFRHVAEHGRADIADEVGVALAAAVVVDDDLQEVGLRGEVGVAARGAEDGIERVDVLNVEADLQVPADGFHRGVDFREYPVFADIKEAIPRDDFRILD